MGKVQDTMWSDEGVQSLRSSKSLGIAFSGTIQMTTQIEAFELKQMVHFTHNKAYNFQYFLKVDVRRQALFLMRFKSKGRESLKSADVNFLGTGDSFSTNQ